VISLVGQGVQIAEETFVHPAVAPALVLVGFLMIRIVPDIDWTRPEDALPAFLAIVGIPLTFSIAAGIGLAILGHLLAYVALGRVREIHPLMWAIGALFVIFFLSDWLGRTVF